jgi:hypothetical protein
MNFSSHIKNLVVAIEHALDQSKATMVEEFRPILKTANSLLKTNRFDFWLKQIDETDISDIPMTKFGLLEAKRHLPVDSKYSRIDLKGTIDYICESLFTYCNDDDMCSLQGDYHYYVHLPTGKVYKESELGSSTLDEVITSSSDIRIAKISELNISTHELVK